MDKLKRRLINKTSQKSNHSITSRLWHFMMLGRKQLRMIVTGAGGTGKTEIIHATVRLAKILFGRTPSDFGPIVVVAPSGAAAANAGGYTWQYMTFTNEGSTFKSTLNAQFDSDMQKKLEGLEVIIFDEFSMLSPEGLYDLERRFRCSQSDPERRKLPFGGRHVIFFGDFYQLSPPGSKALYSILPENDSLFAWRDKGYKIWREFDSFAELVENVRYHFLLL
jgi:hypothetical protein